MHLDVTSVFSCCVVVVVLLLLLLVLLFYESIGSGRGRVCLGKQEHLLASGKYRGRCGLKVQHRLKA